MVQEIGIQPPSFSRDQLRKLLLEAIDNAEDADNPETFHALFDHPERGLDTNDTIHGLQREWKFERPPSFNRDFWQWKYFIDSESVGGDAITIVVAVDTARREFEVITRWRQ
jgi:hypothetical protein